MIFDTFLKKLWPIVHWYDTNQLDRYKVQYQTYLPGEFGFDNFFDGNKCEINQSAKEIMKLHWDTEAPDGLNTTQQSLINDAFAFQCSQSEFAVETFSSTIFKIFNIPGTFRKTSTLFGQADVLGSNAKYGVVSAVIENKCGGAYTNKKRKMRRCQLAAYMISIAIQNATIVKDYGKVFE